MLKIVYCFLIFVLIQPIEESMLWEESYKLKWSDFKGQPKNNIDAAALTVSGITLDISAKTTETKLIEFTVIVEARFYHDQSWYRKEMASPFILAHEQLHFDITELYARKFRYQIDKTTFSIHIKKEMEKLNKAINTELKDMQEKYDRDSNFSRNVETQRKWQKYIRTELKNLSKYK